MADKNGTIWVCHACSEYSAGEGTPDALDENETKEWLDGLRSDFHLATPGALVDYESFKPRRHFKEFSGPWCDGCSFPYAHAGPRYAMNFEGYYRL